MNKSNNNFDCNAKDFNLSSNFIIVNRASEVVNVHRKYLDLKFICSFTKMGITYETFQKIKYLENDCLDVEFKDGKFVLVPVGSIIGYCPK